MNIFALEIWYDEGSICTFYTVRFLDDDRELESETDRFFETYIQRDKYREEGYILFRLLTESIGNKYGATDDFFNRYENKALSLPPKPYSNVEEIIDIGINFPLRLFCYRISKHIVILFNGGIKESKTVQESKSLSMKFYEAQQLVRKIEEAMYDNVVFISENERYLINYDYSTEIIL